MTDNKFTDSIDWDDVRYFETLAGQRTLSAAARVLGVTHATVARRVTRLTAQFDGPLFIQRSDGYALTALGEALRVEARRMRLAESAIGGLRRGMSTRPTVRVSVMRSLGDLFVVPNLGALSIDLAGIELELMTETRIASLAKWEADIAIRLDAKTDSDLVGRVVARNRYRLFAASDAPRDRFIGFLPDDRSPQSAWMETHANGRPFALRSNSMIAQRAAAIAGLGVALLPSFLASGTGLVAFDTPAPPPDRQLVLLSRRKALETAPVRTVFDTLVTLFRTYWPG